MTYSQSITGSTLRGFLCNGYKFHHCLKLIINLLTGASPLDLAKSIYYLINGLTGRKSQSKARDTGIVFSLSFYPRPLRALCPCPLCSNSSLLWKAALQISGLFNKEF